MGVYICNIQKRSNWIRLCRTRGVVTVSVAVGDDRFNTMAFTYSDIPIEDSLRAWVSDASIQAELPNEKKYSHTQTKSKNTRSYRVAFAKLQRRSGYGRDTDSGSTSGVQDVDW